MGIKGIYQEIGTGERTALAKLAAESLEQNGRRLRIAVDIAIWQFQGQAAQGGSNPELRNIFHRITRLLSYPVEPIFVFDGPYKPKVKRNKLSGRGDSVANAQAKRMIRLFGCNIHEAPGEAEAECALLQRHGIVDAVLSEDVDTLMFGCTKMLRRWSPHTRRQKIPTHVSVFDTEQMNLADQGLDREGMVLVAMMSGGDYDPNGLSGCGVKVAAEAAKAGFGNTLCQLKASDEEGIQAWRDSLIHELHTNESGYFKRRNKALVVPNDFPDFKTLRYYTHPVVSPESSLDEIRDKLHQKREIQLEDLREYAREVLGWDYRVGAVRFIRLLSHMVLINKLLDSGYDSVGYVKNITGFRRNIMNDNVSEVRLQHVPIEVIPIDLSKEADERIVQGRTGLALNSDEELEEAENIEEVSTSKSTTRPFTPSERYGMWVLEAVARQSVPELVADAELRLHKRELNKTKPKSKPKKDMPTGALKKHDDRLLITKTISPIESKVTSQLSKQPTSTSGSPVRQTTTPWSLASSQVTPSEKRRMAQQQAIVITSSPPCAADSPPPSPSPQPRAHVPASRQLPGTMRTIATSSGSPQRIKGSMPKPGHTKPSNTSQASQLPKLKQTSMDMFTKRSKAPIASQPSLAKPAALPPKQQPKPQTTFDEDFDSDSSSDLLPLSNLLSRSPKSPNKRNQRPLPPNRSTSPSPAPSRKKKLLIPRASAVGFFKEVEVDAEERDERLARETAALERRGVRANVVRVSDIGFIDLTQDD
ncbi:hypothetical protein FSARC_1516 [Fusarium sarcochroum]|uniref:Uncharacterized protein n=1 Tax=Fusarium sarcochroum TaxID=1208366 RepID=A0A8H4XE23_9HYPO|nr:hypothetical protein FSARC_1516 [Fusarium sarcochroum]